MFVRTSELLISMEPTIVNTQMVNANRVVSFIIIKFLFVYLMVYFSL